MTDDSDSNWWVAKSTVSGEAGFIPSNYVAEQQVSLLQSSWDESLWPPHPFGSMLSLDAVAEGARPPS